MKQNYDAFSIYFEQVAGTCMIFLTHHGAVHLVNPQNQITIQ